MPEAAGPSPARARSRGALRGSERPRVAARLSAPGTWRARCARSALRGVQCQLGRTEPLGCSFVVVFFSLFFFLSVCLGWGEGAEFGAPLCSWGLAGR